MRRSAPFAVAAAALAAAAAGCGSAATVPRPSPPPATAAELVQGRHVFARSCSYCHGLSGTESARRQGGDLAAFRMSEAQIESETRIMPERRPLSAAEVRAVSQYVFGVQRAHAR